MEGRAWASLNFNVYARSLIHCLYFIYAGKIYVRTHVEITRLYLFPGSKIIAKAHREELRENRGGRVGGAEERRVKWGL